MKKKIVRIILIIIGIAILFVAGSAIWIYNFTQKSEKIAGKQVPIPLKNTLADLITKGSSDRSSWQGENSQEEYIHRPCERLVEGFEKCLGGELPLPG